MGPTQKLARTVCVLLIMYFATAAFFVAQSHARINDGANPAPPPAVVGCEHPAEAAASPGHFKLHVTRDPRTLSLSQWRLITSMLKKDLQRRFGDVQILTISDVAKTDGLGAINVVVDAWKERPYWGPLGHGSAETKLPSYIALRMDVRSSTGANWDGSHRLNANRRIPGSTSRLTFQNAQKVQVREMVASMLDRLPPLHHYPPLSDE